jgi:hypothetical protein
MQYQEYQTSAWKSPYGLTLDSMRYEGKKVFKNAAFWLLENMEDPRWQ